MENPLKTKILRISLATCLIAVVVGVRWAVIASSGSDLPTWDQWDAEALRLLSPWFNHVFSLSDLLEAHNEHRVVLTKLVNLGLTVANGQWDQRLESAVNAFLPALIAAGLFNLGCRATDRRWHAPIFVFVAALYALPFAWQNVDHGFHSQQLFLILLSFGAIVWLPSAAPWSGRWWLGAVCAVLVLGSMASGFIAAVVVIGLLALRLKRLETSFPDAAPTLVLCLLLIVVGLGTHVTVEYNDAFKAHSVPEFTLSIIRSLQWPSLGDRWSCCAILLWLPWGWLTWQVWAETVDGAGPEKRFEGTGQALIGLGGWVGLQILATAYARGAGGPPPASRYIDTLVFGAAVNALALGWLWREGSARTQTAILGSAWVLVFGAGAYFAIQTVFRSELPTERTRNYYTEENVRNYLATGDEAYLHHNEIPYPTASEFIWRVRIPVIQALLPASVRLPLPLVPASRSEAFVRYDSRSPQREAGEAEPVERDRPAGFSPDTPPLSNRITWGSFGQQGATGTGSWQSKPLRAKIGGWLKFEVAGQLGQPGLALELQDPATHRVLAEVRPNKTPGDSWRSVYVPAPRGDFVVVARDEDPQGWLAFSQPVEMAPLSYVAWLAVKRGRLMAEIAAALGLLVLIASARESGSDRRRSRL